jgi:alanyl-tRNA synthetase
MNQIDIRKEWIDFMKSRGHDEVPNVPLLPENDPTLLFVNSGMFPLVKYLSGQVESPSKRLFNVQRCVRFDDIEEVGDDRHTSFFHMMGNWSLGDYFKDTQLPQLFEFLVDILKIDPSRLYVTVFEGNESAPRDEESIKIWKEIFHKYTIEAEVSNINFDQKSADPLLKPNPNWSMDKNPNERIFAYPMKKNWWKRGDAVGELGGPDSEIFYDTKRTHDMKYGAVCHVNCDCGRFIEIGNNVFMQYVKNEQGGWDPLPQKNVDFGGGLERIAMAVMHESDIFLTPEFYPIIQKIEEISKSKYENNKKAFQIIADHMRGATFIIADGAVPSNKDQGYIVRRLIRRSIRQAKYLDIENNFAKEVVTVIVEMFKSQYPFLEEKQNFIVEEIEKEESKFNKTLQKGLFELLKLITDNQLIQPTTKPKFNISAEQVFNLYQSYGFPIELSIEEIKDLTSAQGLMIDENELKENIKQYIKIHQEASRAGSEQKFKGGLADSSEKTTAFHSTAHLFLEAARRVLGEHVHQRGSNITSERIRFDFAHPQKLTDEEIKKIEDIVNEQIDLELERTLKEYNTDEAFKLGAEGEFREKYGDKVNVYKFSQTFDPTKHASLQKYTAGILKAIEADRDVEDHFKNEYVFSFEICGGPHVNNTNEIKKFGKFKITKEESSSAGVRRIKAELV